MKITLTKSEQETLAQHESVESCTQKYIRYTPVFKEQALRQYHEGISSREIFSSIPLPDTHNTPEYRRDAIRRWKCMHAKYGAVYTQRKQGNNGRALKRHHEFNAWYSTLTTEQKLAYCEAENEILKKVPLVFRKPRLWELYERLSQSGKSETLSRDARKGASH